MNALKILGIALTTNSKAEKQACFVEFVNRATTWTLSESKVGKIKVQDVVSHVNGVLERQYFVPNGSGLRKANNEERARIRAAIRKHYR